MLWLLVYQHRKRLNLLTQIARANRKRMWDTPLIRSLGRRNGLRSFEFNGSKKCAFNRVRVICNKNSNLLRIIYRHYVRTLVIAHITIDGAFFD